MGRDVISSTGRVLRAFADGRLDQLAAVDILHVVALDLLKGVGQKLASTRSIRPLSSGAWPPRPSHRRFPLRAWLSVPREGRSANRRSTTQRTRTTNGRSTYTTPQPTAGETTGGIGRTRLKWLPQRLQANVDTIRAQSSPRFTFSTTRQPEIETPAPSRAFHEVYERGHRPTRDGSRACRPVRSRGRIQTAGRAGARRGLGSQRGGERHQVTLGAGQFAKLVEPPRLQAEIGQRKPNWSAPSDRWATARSTASSPCPVRCNKSINVSAANFVEASSAAVASLSRNHANPSSTRSTANTRKNVGARDRTRRRGANRRTGTAVPASSRTAPTDRFGEFDITGRQGARHPHNRVSGARHRCDSCRWKNSQSRPAISSRKRLTRRKAWAGVFAPPPRRFRAGPDTAS